MFKPMNEPINQHQPEKETVIGASVKIKGNLNSKGNIVVRGQLTGTIRTEADVIIESTAKIFGSIQGNNVLIAGEVNGSISCFQKLELTASAKLLGDIETRDLIIALGANFNGKTTMGQTIKPIVNDSSEESDDYGNKKSAKPASKPGDKNDRVGLAV